MHKEYRNYISEFEKMGLLPDFNVLSKSYRCSPTICKFISDFMKIKIESHRIDETIVEYIKNKDDAKIIFDNPKIVKLFYKEHFKYNCFSRNWGDSKGEDKYIDVCTVMNKNTMDFYIKNKLNELPPATKNKLYVALSRTNNNLYLIPEKFLK